MIVERVGSRSFRTNLDAGLSDEVLETVDSLSAKREIDTGIVRITAEGDEGMPLPRSPTPPPRRSSPATRRPRRSQPRRPRPAVIVEVIDQATPDSGSGNETFVPIMLASVVLGAILALVVAVIAQQSSRALELTTRVRNEVGVPGARGHPDDARVAGRASRTERTAAARVHLRSWRHSMICGPGSRLCSPMRTERWLSPRGSGTRAARRSPPDSASCCRRSVSTPSSSTPISATHSCTSDSASRSHGHVGVRESRGEHLITPTSHPKLELVSAGVAKSHPAQILAVALPETLEEVKTQSSQAVVLLDAPPLHPVRTGGIWVQMAAETSTVLRAAGRVLFVVDASTPHLPELAVAVERLQEEGVIVVGAVVNRRRRGLPWRR